MDLTTGSGTSTRGIHTAEPPSSLQLPLLHAPAETPRPFTPATGPPRPPPAHRHPHPAARVADPEPAKRGPQHRLTPPGPRAAPAHPSRAGRRRRPQLPTTAVCHGRRLSVIDKVVTAKEDLASRRRYAAPQRESFDGGHLASVRLQQLWFTRRTFRRADLRQATLDGCRFKLCDLRGANLSGASLRGVCLVGCDLSRAPGDHEGDRYRGPESPRRPRPPLSGEVS
ncbi:pentapeptide repeat-containing protein [Streptomyces sp. NPDC056661]|uniref:pentapeptide repeat-containing protein n=1 Tax=Streptomyces sp. NPDC056661 TaxID=3345898 RepID=UPI003699337A